MLTFEAFLDGLLGLCDGIELDKCVDGTPGGLRKYKKTIFHCHHKCYSNPSDLIALL